MRRISYMVLPRATAILLCLCILCTLCNVCALTVNANTLTVSQAAPEDERIGAAYLCNLENDLILYEKNADVIIYPASSVKIMTGLLACRALADRLDEKVTVTAAMLAGTEGRNMRLTDGEELTVKDLLYAALCGSYNDAASVIAYLSAGSVAAFVEQMNAEAKRVGAASTLYTNPTGLFDPSMVTTAADTALIARQAWGNELYMTIVSADAYTIPATNVSDTRYFTNRNALVSDTAGQYYNGWCRGMNAGMIDESKTGVGGWCVVTVWERDGASNLAIVMEGADAATAGDVIPAYRYINRLLSWAKGNYGYRSVFTEGQVVDTRPVAMTGTSKSQTQLCVPGNVSLYLPLEANLKELTYTCVLEGDGLTAPLSAGQRVGTVTVSYQGEIVGIAPLTVNETFSRNGFLDSMEQFKAYLMSRAFIATVVFFILILCLYLRLTTGPGRRYGVKSTRRRASYRARRRYR